MNANTPNWGPDNRYQLIRIIVKIQDEHGLTREQVEKLCKRFEKIALGRTKERKVSAIC